MDYIKIPLYLSGPNASVDRTDTVTIGTAGSYGVHAFEITRGRNWEGLDIKATFYQKPDNSSTTTTPSDEVIQITVIETSDNLVPIPAEILQVETIEPGSEPPETWVTFSGYDGETLKMNSLRLMLEISDTGPSYKTPMSSTPDIEEQLINAVKGYRDEATKAAETAVDARDEAIKQAEDALNSANSAFDSKNAALESEICAAISASKAKDSENEAAVSAENAKASEEKAKEYADNSQAIYDKGIEEVKEYSDLASQKATEAGEYAQDALEYSETALEHRNAAKTSEDNAKTSETNAAKSAEQANQYAGNAQGFMSRAQTYANAASESQIAAASSASKAASSETNAKASRDEAVKAANNALSYQNLAQSYATQASGSAGAAATSAKNAAESEKNAEARAIESSNYATASQGSAQNSAASAQEAKGYAQQGNTILEQVKQHGAEIESIAAKTPIINETNDLWQLWDKDEQAYVDTDVLAKGQGVAQGGAPGQILVKKSVANYDTEWVDKEDVHTYSIEKQAVADEGFLSTYYLTKDGSQVGTKINIPKDYLVNEASLKEVTETDVPYSGAVIGDLYIDFVVNTKNDDSSDSHIYLPVNQLVDVYTGGNGIDINSSNTISVVIDSNSANGLSVSNTGVKLSLATEITAGAMSANDKIALKNAESDIDAIEGDITSIKNGATSLPYIRDNAGSFTGGLTGDSLTLSGNAIASTAPTEDAHLTNKKYVDEKVASVDVSEQLTPLEERVTQAESDIDAIPIVSDSDMNGNIKINDVESTVYTHPSYTAYGKKLYKIQSDDKGHIVNADEVTKSDITILGIPAQDTTYTDATTTKSGLMSATDKIALNTAVEDIVDIKEDYVSNGVNNVAKGNPAICNDSIEWPLQGMRVYGKSTQVSTTGAQKISFPLWNEAVTKNGVTLTPTDSGFKVNGTATEQTDFISDNSYSLEENDYILSNDGIRTAADRLCVYKSTGASYCDIIIDNNTSTVSHILAGNYFVLYRVLAGQTVNKEYSHIMLNAGSTPLPYEPYTGGKPSPSPEYPQEIHSAGDDGEISITLSDGANQSQALAFSTPNGLPGIPVDSGGNFVDETGQEWICNYRDWARGVDVQNFGECVVDGSTVKFIYNNNPENPFWNLPENSAPNIISGENKTIRSIYFPFSVFGVNNNREFIWTRPTRLEDYEFTSVEELNAFCVEKNSEGKPLTIMYTLKSPIETPIPADELAAYRALHTYDGTTIIFSPDPLAEIEFNYTTSNQTNLPYIKNKGDSVSGTYDFTLAELNVAEPVEDSNPVTKGYLDGKIEEIETGLGSSYTGGNGIDISEDNVISVKVDSTNSNGIEVTEQGIKLNPATSSTSGAMSGADKAKLDASSTTEQMNQAISTAVSNATNPINSSINSINDSISKLTNGTTELPYIKDTGDTVSGSYDFTGATVKVAEPTENANVTTKQYVDNKVNSEASTREAADEELQNNIDAVSNAKLNKANPSFTGTMVGETLNVTSVNISGTPSANTHAVTKAYVDNAVESVDVTEQLTPLTNRVTQVETDINTAEGNISNLQTEVTNIKNGTTSLGYMKTSNPTYTGNLTGVNAAFSGNVTVPTPDANGEATNKSYVDSSISSAVSAAKNEVTSQLGTQIDNIPVVSKSNTNGNIKIDNVETTVYTHPTHTQASEGLYKVSVDNQGHINTHTAVAKQDITALGIPGQDTTYSNATTSTAGLMSPTDKMGLETAIEDIEKIKEDYTPNAKNIAQGNPVYIEDTTDNPFTDLRILGKTERITTTGAQLVRFNIYEPIENANGTATCIPTKDGFKVCFLKEFTNSDVSTDIYFVGTNGTAQSNFEDYSAIMPAGTYYYYLTKQNYVKLAVVCTTDSPGLNQTLVNLKVGEGSFTVPEGVKLRIFFRLYPSVKNPYSVVDIITPYVGSIDVKFIIKKVDDDLKYEPYTGGVAKTILAYPPKESYALTEVKSLQLLDIANEDWTYNDMDTTYYELYENNAYSRLFFEVVGRSNGNTYALGMYCNFPLINFDTTFNGYVSFDMMVENTTFSSFKILGKTIPVSEFTANTLKHFNFKIDNYITDDQYSKFYLYFWGVNEGDRFYVRIDNLMITPLDHEIPYQQYKPSQFLKSYGGNWFGINISENEDIATSFVNYADLKGDRWITNYRSYDKGTDYRILDIIDINPEEIDTYPSNDLVISKEVRYDPPEEFYVGSTKAPLMSDVFALETTWDNDKVGICSWGSNAIPYRMCFRLAMEEDAKEYFTEHPTKTVLMLDDTKADVYPIIPEESFANWPIFGYAGGTSVETFGVGDNLVYYGTKEQYNLPYLTVGGDVCFGDYDFTHAILEVSTPTENSHAATKKYVDDSIGAIDINTQIQPIENRVDTVEGSITTTMNVLNAILEKKNENTETTGTSTIASMTPNVLYKFLNTDMTQITITVLGTLSDSYNSYVTTYHMIFKSGATPTVLNLPDGVILPDGFEIEANRIYEINIMENLLTYQSWPVS